MMDNASKAERRPVPEMVLVSALQKAAERATEYSKTYDAEVWWELSIYGLRLTVRVEGVRQCRYLMPWDELLAGNMGLPDTLRAVERRLLRDTIVQELSRWL